MARLSFDVAKEVSLVSCSPHCILPGVMWLTSGTLRQMYDCYVIGSGPAGITLALELAKANKKVLLFESGTAIDARADMPNAINYGHLRDGWWDKHSIRTLGGTSKVWTGWCVTLRERDFDNPAVGVRWPIARPELWCINTGKSLIPLTLLFLAQKRNLLIPLELSRVMHQGSRPEINQVRCVRMNK